MTKLEKMAIEYASVVPGNIICGPKCEQAFIAGAKSLIEMLMDDEANEKENKHYEEHCSYPIARTWAQWLESECAKEVE